MEFRNQNKECLQVKKRKLTKASLDKIFSTIIEVNY